MLLTSLGRLPSVGCNRLVVGAALRALAPLAPFTMIGIVLLQEQRAALYADADSHCPRRRGRRVVGANPRATRFPIGQPEQSQIGDLAKLLEVLLKHGPPDVE